MHARLPSYYTCTIAFIVASQVLVCEGKSNCHMAFVLWGITIGGLDYWNDSSNLPQNASISARQKLNILSYFAFSSIMPGVFGGQKASCIFN